MMFFPDMLQHKRICREEEHSARRRKFRFKVKCDPEPSGAIRSNPVCLQSNHQCEQGLYSSSGHFPGSPLADKPSPPVLLSLTYVSKTSILQFDQVMLYGLLTSKLCRSTKTCLYFQQAIVFCYSLTTRCRTSLNLSSSHGY